MPRNLQKRMFQEMEQKDIFTQAQKYAFDYACAQRFKTNFFMLNMTFITNALTGSN